MVNKMQQKPFNIKGSFAKSCKFICQFINPKTSIDEIVYLRSSNFADEVQKNNEETKELCEAFNLPHKDHLDESDISTSRKVRYGFLGVTVGFKALITSIHTYFCKSALSHANQLKNAANHLQGRLIGVATLVNTTDLFQQLATRVPEMNTGLSLLHDPALFDNPLFKDTSFQNLISLLQTFTFKGDASFFSLTGRVLAAHSLMEEHKDKFAPMMEAIGEIDACLAIAKLYKQYQDKPVRFCFVDFVQSEKPVLQLSGFWNPFVEPSCVVVNNIELGLNHRNIVLTGSNTGGKSTALKGIMLGAWLAQTLGIAPATKVVMSPFMYLGTSLNISDQTKKGNSLFKAEVLRAKSILNSADALADNEFGFVIIDELFVGTASEKGSQESYKVAKRLAKKENSLFILATHFPELTNLEQDTDGVCKNFKMDIYKDDAGSLVRTYKLEPGISTCNVADEIFEEEINSIQ